MLSSWRCSRLMARRTKLPDAVLVDEDDGEGAVVPDLPAEAGGVHGIGQALRRGAEQDEDPAAVGLPARTAFAVEHDPGLGHPVLVLEPILVALGVGIGIAPLPELGDEVVPAALRQLEEDLALLLGDDVADLGQELGVGRRELPGDAGAPAGRERGQAGEEEGGAESGEDGRRDAHLSSGEDGAHGVFILSPSKVVFGGRISKSDRQPGGRSSAFASSGERPLLRQAKAVLLWRRGSLSAARSPGPDERRPFRGAGNGREMGEPGRGPEAADDADAFGDAFRRLPGKPGDEIDADVASLVARALELAEGVLQVRRGRLRSPLLHQVRVGGFQAEIEGREPRRAHEPGRRTVDLPEVKTVRAVERQSRAGRGQALEQGPGVPLLPQRSASS